MSQKTRITIELPESLKKAVEDFAARDGVSTNQYITRALAEKIGARGAAEFFAERGKNGDPAWAIAFLESRPE
ncbi:MAG: hypothetical protein JNN02_06030 [Tabrizicola sp.]|nr:hypothetical protein [Tabrizicola sp.]